MVFGMLLSVLSDASLFPSGFVSGVVSEGVSGFASGFVSGVVSGLSSSPPSEVLAAFTVSVVLTSPYVYTSVMVWEPGARVSNVSPGQCHNGAALFSRVLGRG